MKNQLLIYTKDEYNVPSYYHIIDKNDLKTYVKDHIKKFLKDSQKRTIIFDYVSDEINWDQNKVVIKYLQHAYTTLNATYKEQSYYDTIHFVELDKIPLWKAQPKAFKTPTQNDNILREKPKDIPKPIMATRLPLSITIDNVEFESNQIVNIPNIHTTPMYADISEEGYSTAPYLPNQKVFLRYDYGSVDLTLKANTDQINKIRQIYDSFINFLGVYERHKTQTLVLTFEDCIIKIEGSIRVIQFPRFDFDNNPEYIDLEISFLVNHIITE